MFGGDAGVLTDIEPRVKARVEQLIAQVGEDEFRRGVAQFTRWHVESMSRDEVIGLYVMARRGRVHPPEVGRRGAEIHVTLPGRTEADAGFTIHGRKVSVDEWIEWRTARLAGLQAT
jgi:hypothetical protein